jgi:RNase P/RNase MRP subunit p30
MERIFLFKEDFNRLKLKVKDNKDKEIVFSSEDAEFNRKVIEKLDVNVLLLKEESRRDYSKQRDSGFNQVMAREVAKKGIVIGIYLDELVLSLDKVRILARVKQNIELCKKFKIKMKFIGEQIKRDSRELKSLGLVLGMSTWMTKEI